MKLNRCCAFNAHNLFDFCSTGVANELVANVTKNLKAFYVNDKELKPFQLLRNPGLPFQPGLKATTPLLLPVPLQKSEAQQRCKHPPQPPGPRHEFFHK